MLNETFFALLKNYTDDNRVTQNLWNEIVKKHAAENRYYHTLQHLENILAQLTSVKEKIQNWETILFSLYYHDIVYNVLQSDNEAQSAALAEKRMTQILVPNETIALCKKQILSTKSHKMAPNSDTNYFTDADLSILGQPWEIYSAYYKNVRKEYAIYPDFLYKRGRKKILNHFLAMDRIFKTEFFRNKFELQARLNLQLEIELL